MKSLTHLRSLAYVLWLISWALGSGVCIYTYPGGTHSISVLWLISLSSGGTGGILGRGHTDCCGGTPVPLFLKHDSGFFALPLWQVRHLSIWFSQIIARCLSNGACTILCPVNSTPHFFSSRTSARSFVIHCCVSSIAARENPPLAILAIFKARRMSDCSSCTRPPCLAVVANMLKTYKTIVAESKSEIQLLPGPYTTPQPPLVPLKLISSTGRDVYHEICLQKSPNLQLHNARFHGQGGQDTWSTMQVSQYRQQYIAHVAL